MDCIELSRQNSLRVARRCIGANRVAAAPRSHPVGAYGGPEAAASKLYFIASVAAFRQRSVQAGFFFAEKSHCRELQRRRIHALPPTEDLLKPGVEVCGALKKRYRAEFAEACGALAIAMLAGGDDGHEGDTGVTRRESIVNVVPQIKRAGGIARPKNFMQSFRMWLFVLYVVHRDDSSEILRGGPAFERKGKLLPCSSGEKIQLAAPRPALDLPGRDDQPFVSNVAGLAVAAPVESLECFAGLVVGNWVAERSHPCGNHGPIVIEARLALPTVQLRVGYALASQMAHRLERRTPIRAADVHEHAVHIKNQDLRLRWQWLAAARRPLRERQRFFRHGSSPSKNSSILEKKSVAAPRRARQAAAGPVAGARSGLLQSHR